MRQETGTVLLLQLWVNISHIKIYIDILTWLRIKKNIITLKIIPIRMKNYKELSIYPFDIFNVVMWLSDLI